jgi:hypothetical protein
MGKREVGFSTLPFSFHGKEVAYLGCIRKSHLISSPLMGEGVKKSIWLFFTSFRRKPESRVFKPLAIEWAPVFTGVTAEIQFFHTFG